MGGGEIWLILVLIVSIGVGVWYFVVADNYRRYLDESVYTRGVNGTAGDSLVMQCGSDKTIRVYKATQVCTNPSSNNFEDMSIDPYNSDGSFNPQTTTDVSQELSECNGSQFCPFEFTEQPFPGGMKCPGEVQLIATYDCV